MDKKTVKGLLFSILGLVSAILILTIGFWKALLIVGLTAVGWWLSGTRQLPQGPTISRAHQIPWD
jgi:hypothetical protein